VDDASFTFYVIFEALTSWRRKTKSRIVLTYVAYPPFGFATVAMTAIACALPQHAFAHYGHHNHKSNSIKVDQNTTQLNFCGQSLCANQADNSTDIDR